MAPSHPATVESARPRPAAPAVRGASHTGVATAIDLLLLSASGELGGAERALLDTVAALRARDPRARIGVLLAAPGPLVAQLEALGVDTIVLPWPSSIARLGDAGLAGGGRGARAMAALRLALAAPATLAYVARLAATVRALRPRVVHTNGFKMHVLGALLPRGDARLVWHLHDFTTSRPLMCRALRALAPRVDAAIANSRSVAEDGARAWGAAMPVTTVYNAVDLDRFRPAGPSADLDALAGLAPAPAGTVRVGLVATLASWKGHELFLRALARLPRDLPVRGYVVSGAIYATHGSQQSLDALRALAARLGVADRVGFTGFVADSAAVMRALDVVVHASTKPEPFGLVIAEGMASGRAVVVSAAGGAAELVEDGVDALAFAPGDEAMLADRIERLVRDAALRARLGAAARASASARFDRERLGDEVAAVHEAAKAAPAAGARR